jgi:hypothetical protein
MPSLIVAFSFMLQIEVIIMSIKVRFVGAGLLFSGCPRLPKFVISVAFSLSLALQAFFVIELGFSGVLLQAT